MNDFTAFSELFVWTSAKMSSIQIDWLPVGALTTLVLLLVLGMLALVIYYISKFILFRIIRSIVKRTPGVYDDIFVSRKFLRRISYVIPMIVIYQLIPYAIPHHAGWIITIRRSSEVVLILFMLTAGYALLDSFYEKYLNTEKSRFKPVKGYLQVVKIVGGFIAAILILSILLSETPGYLLGGLGAVSAVLLLVFKDTILGFVASVQLSSNDMVMLGDWITVDKCKADGEVVEITLSSVKVRNFDNTFTYVPTYGMISDSFQNWRGMKESPGRRIKRPVNIHVGSIHFVTEEELEKFRKIDLISSYIESKQKELDEINSLSSSDSGAIINLRQQTNIGIYRIYLLEYLKSIPTFNHNEITMVRQLPPADDGIPIEVYAFSVEKDWEKYEVVMADIFDHILASTQYFGLEIFQAASGSDLRSLAGKH
ncbi:Miniconductance mechanosensitive channel YbdG [bioreactor metagenome]|uniref:Miniconductance mechanosensitive channel YbdG n=1 Tax=bioreactor metagenome TaxID=1076179 RepID=A0A644WGN3_9ZZZZ